SGPKEPASTQMRSIVRLRTLVFVEADGGTLFLDEGGELEQAQCPDPSVINQTHWVDRQAITLFLIAPMTAVSMAPPAPPAIACETMPLILRLPDCAAATTAGRANVAICPSTPPPTKPEIMLPAVPRSKVGDALPAPTPPSAPAMRLIKICSMSIPL